MGWNSLTRRVVQHGFMMLGQPPEYDENDANQWRGPEGIISTLQEYVGLSGWRSKKVIKEIIRKCLQDPLFDADNREKGQKPRKRKLKQKGANLAGKMLRHGSGTHWAATFVNRSTLDNGGSEKDTVSRRTLERTLKNKYDAIVHRRQTKKTGSKDKNSVWAKARTALGKQLLIQLGACVVLIMRIMCCLISFCCVFLNRNKREVLFQYFHLCDYQKRNQCRQQCKHHVHYKDYADQHLFSLLFFPNSFSESHIIYHLKQVAMQPATRYCNQPPTNLPRACFGASNIILTPHNPFVSSSFTSVLFYFCYHITHNNRDHCNHAYLHSICIR